MYHVQGSDEPTAAFSERELSAADCRVDSSAQGCMIRKHSLLQKIDEITCVNPVEPPEYYYKEQLLQWSSAFKAKICRWKNASFQEYFQDKPTFRHIAINCCVISSGKFCASSESIVGVIICRTAAERSYQCK